MRTVTIQVPDEWVYALETKYFAWAIRFLITDEEHRRLPPIDEYLSLHFQQLMESHGICKEMERRVQENEEYVQNRLRMQRHPQRKPYWDRF